MGTVVLDALTAAYLVDGALNHLWDAVCAEKAGGCCPGCCNQCAAVLQLEQTGQLDALVAPFAERFAAGLWAAGSGRVDRRLLDRAWAAVCPLCGPVL